MKNTNTTKEALFPVSSSKYPYSNSSLSSDSKPYLAAREETRLTLRKRRLDDHLLKKREELLRQRNTHSKYEISLSTLSLPNEITAETFQSSTVFVNKMISYLQSNSIDIKKFAILKLREATVRQEAIDEMYQYNIVDYLFPLMNDNAQDDTIVYEVLWVLINVTTKYTTPEMVTKLISEYSYNFYVKAFSKNIPDIKENILWLLSNVTFESPTAAMSLMKSAFIQDKLIPYLKEEQAIVKCILRHSLFLLSTITGYLNYDSQINKVNAKFAQTEAEIAKMFCTFIDADPCFVNDCLYGLAKVSNSTNQKVHSVIFESGIVRRIIKNEFHFDNFLNDIIRLIGNYLSNIENSNIIDKIFSKEIITFLGGYIVNSGDSSIVHDSLWALSNMCCGTEEQMTLVIDSNLVPILISKCKGPNNIVGFEAVYCLSNLVTCEDINIILKVAQYDIIEVFLSIVDKYWQNRECIRVIVQGFTSMFTEGQKIVNQTGNVNIFVKTFWEKGGKDILDKLQNYQDNDVYEMVAAMIKQYFSY